ncbi:NADPH:quinone oxidoreductase family protein [Profundibacterium mesophilum]|uniref:Alcohol dehydrogenase n=1 Tax=Profundibacterium mesophilum KAUST100406-0324 TaxID=1037889 RepID=A0A921NQB0_9RHOB|nr:NADPH:quinone oxidoreductase family protein [Profundibacterium mesophilum]KAF0675395.1 alcohol dehydrogenase [Profundibacterium mesophilum KAUST100406-0324]
MKAFQVTAHDAPPRLHDIAIDAPAIGEVQLAVEACGLNFADLLQSKGQYQERRPLPVTLGMEFAGTVIAHGPGAEAPPIGSRVAVFAGAGGLAERANVPAERCIPLPAGMPFTDAAGFMVAYGTSHLALTRRARLAPGETLLVLGAAGGVGLTAVEVGKALGARVIACARGRDKLEIARRAGADHLIESETEDLREAVLALGGADVVYDPVGGALFDAALRACRPEARILAIGFASGTVPQIKANHLLVKNVTVEGFYWGGYATFAPALLDGSLATLFEWYAQDRLRPHVGDVLPLARAGEGLELLRSRRAVGKVVVTCGTE